MTKHKKIHFLLIFLLIFPLKLLYQQNSQFKFRHITTNDGLSAPSVNSIIKDKQGFIWLATGIGLSRYDGYSFIEYQNNPLDSNSLSSNLLTGKLFLDQSGDLWVGTKDQGLNQFNIATETITRYQHDSKNPNSLSHNNVHKLLQDRDGSIWVATLGGGINKFNVTELSFSSFYPEPADKTDNANFIQSMVEFDDQNILVGTRRSLYLFNKSTKLFSLFSSIYKCDFLSEEENIADIILEESILWIGTENGLIRYNIDNNTSKRFNSIEEDSKSLSSNVIRQIINSPNTQYLWISTIWGLNRFDKKSLTAERYLYNSDDPKSIGFNMLWGLYIDESNLLWIGTDNAGVNILNLNKNAFHHIKMEGSFPDNKQFSASVFSEDKQNNFWVGTFGGGLWQFDANYKLKKHYQYHPDNPNGLSSNTIFSLCEDPDQNMWVGTSNGGINKLNNGQLTRMQITHNNLKNDPTSIIEIAIDQQKVLWLGTLIGLYFYDKSNEIGIENIEIKPLNNALIRSICIDRNNNLWIGTHGDGMFKLNLTHKKNQSFKTYRHYPDNPQSINSDVIMSIYEDNTGEIWIASNQGLNKYLPDIDGFESFDKKNGLASDYLYHIQGEKNGVLWITSSHGLIRFDSKANEKQRSRLFEFNRGVSVEDIYPYSFYLRQNGEICIGGKSGSDYGYYSFHPDSIRFNTVIPKIAVTSFKVKNEDYELDSVVSLTNEIQLKHNQNFITFEFAALDYTETKKNQYAYFLEGFDPDWNYVGNRHFANYTGIPPGKYIFRVKGSNNDGYWNESGTSINITILSPPWKTWWAYLLYILGIVAIIYSIFYYYFRRQKLLHNIKLLEEEKRMLAAKSLIEGQEDERKRIAKELHDGLGVLLSAASMQVSSIKFSATQNSNMIKRATSLLDQAINDVRRISHNMMPGLLTKFGIFEAIRDLIDKINETQELSASLKVQGSEERLPEKVEIMIYRITQELINNTLKHAGAKVITIEIHMLPEQINITYTDDGVGFNLDTVLAQKSIGLQSIHSRLNFLDGELNIISDHGKGAVFNLKIPI